MDNTITSAQNPRIKQLKRLYKSSKERQEANLYIAEGAHLSQSYLASGHTPMWHIYAVSAQKNQEIATIIKELSVTSSEESVVSDSIFESISSMHASVGICVVFKRSEPARVALTPLTANAVLLEDIQDPGNMGTILRTAAAVGIRNILLSPQCASPWSPKALRAGMGAQFSLDIFENVDLKEVLQQTTITSIATVLQENSVSLYKMDLDQPIAWVFGSEGQGMSESLASRTKYNVMIPQEHSTIESLNVAAAATVCLYEQYRQKIQ